MLFVGLQSTTDTHTKSNRRQNILAVIAAKAENYRINIPADSSMSYAMAALSLH
jgi:hypothetical protein